MPNGQKIMGEKPWTEESLTRTSWLDTPGLESGVDFLRGRWDAETKELMSTMKTWHSRTVSIGIVARGLQHWDWAVYVDGMLVKTERILEKSDNFNMEIEVGGKDVGLVVLRFVN